MRLKKYYPLIQVFRGVLFLFVLGFHCEIPGSSFWWAGVESFFVISAFFLVYNLWEKEQIEVKQLFKRRINRLYPAYIMVLILGVLFALISKIVPYDIVTHVFSLQDFHWMITGYRSAMQPITAHTWTLGIEVWLGLLWLYLIRLQKKRTFKITMYVMIFIAFTYRTIAVVNAVDVYYISLNPISHMDAFAIGALLAIALKEGKEEKRYIRLFWGLCILGVIGIIISIVVLGSYNDISLVEAYRLLGTPRRYFVNVVSGNIYFYIQLVTAGIVGMMCLWNGAEVKSWILKSFEKLGDMSYNLYLFHWPIVCVCGVLFDSWYVKFLLTLLCSIIGSVLFDKTCYKNRISR